MNIKNIEIREDILILRTGDGMTYRLSREEVSQIEGAWIDNILSSAVSLIYSTERKNGKMSENLQNMNQLGEKHFWREDDYKQEDWEMQIKTKS